MQLRIRRAVYHHIAGTFQMLTINLHIAGQQKPAAAAGPVRVKSIELRARIGAQIGQTFGHGGLGNAIGNLLAVG